MKPTLALLLVGVVVSAVPGTAAASGPTVHPPTASGDAPPAWPGGQPETNNSTVPPGQQLAGAVGAQGASVQSELWNRTLADRLDNASTPNERAEVLADETATLETYLDALAAVRANVTGAWENGTISEGEYRTTLSAFVVRAHAVERRANRTAKAVRNLPARTRERHGMNVTYVQRLPERAHDLYQFEGEVGRQVANETLTGENETALVGTSGDASDRSSTNR